VPSVDWDAVGDTTQAERALLEVLDHRDGASSFELLVNAVHERQPDLSNEDLRGAIWALASRGVLEVTWDGELTPALA
jgi:hypothetical protein